ncbi:inositol monophosphatase family protein [Aliifodinibius sp. S!AR15-10]|uniref:inositol monophosphatase family protein n=1 Tax=Aliifodinibius sp. S!AR15-10 TaxID=2950437 RepID=UPI0028639571|nr:inositol monophosphatase family protein [Aliifodinibius sp. S!AR15-10]MDR8390421.1 inositol monophosphatase family protein [Aliifodinibius sp. S!AR15-10]
MNFDLTTLHEAAIEIARKGGDHTLQYFKNAVEVEFKDDASPVTVADREAERLMRDEIQDRFPEHGIVGEEFENVNTDSDIKWILDPIDGTLSFIHGIPFYTTLIGVLHKDEPKIGIVYAPALDEMCEGAEGRGTRLNGEPCFVRSNENLSEASFLSTDVTTPAEYSYEKPFSELLDTTRVHRTWGDAYGHMMVAAGRADLMFDPVLNIWDAAPLLTVVREAGGIFCDTNGKETIESGNGFSCSKALYPSVIKIFKKYSNN